MTSQTPQEKKCSCDLQYYSEEDKKDLLHLLSCPLYTPPAQEERMLRSEKDDLAYRKGYDAGFIEGRQVAMEILVRQQQLSTEVKIQPPQLKKPECICSFNDPEHRENCPVIKEPEMWQSQFLNQGTKMTGMDLSCMVGLVSSFIYDARLSAAAEERKRVCEEMLKQLPSKASLKYCETDYEAGSTTAYEDVISLIESTKI